MIEAYDVAASSIAAVTAATVAESAPLVTVTVVKPEGAVVVVVVVTQLVRAIVTADRMVFMGCFVSFSGFR